jgi:hypothetical protein
VRLHGIYFAWAHPKGKPIPIPNHQTDLPPQSILQPAPSSATKSVMKCPAAGCDSTMMHRTTVDGLPMLTCTHGHIICVDSSAQLANFTHQLTSIVTALATHMQAVEKSLADLKKSVENLSSPK